MSGSNNIPNDALVAGTLSAGILMNVVDRDDVVVWADYNILKTDVPPALLIELSLSQHLHFMDLMYLLASMATGADRINICRNVYGFLPDPTDYSIEQLESFARQCYAIAYHCLNGDWTYSILCQANEIDDMFALNRNDTLRVVDDIKQFIATNRDDSVKKFIDVLRRNRRELRQV